MKNTAKFFSIIFAIAIFMCSVPVTAFADTIYTEQMEAIDSDINSVELIPNPNYIDTNSLEITERREENVKHFRHSDGTIEAIVYGYPVHRRDNCGVWKDIDNRLNLYTIGDESFYSTSDGTISFAHNLSNGKLISLNSDCYNVELSLLPTLITTDTLDTSSTIALNTTKRSEATINNHQFFSDKISSYSKNISNDEKIDELRIIDTKTFVTYEDVYNNIDFEYIIDGNDIKENIIVYEKQPIYEFVFNLNVSNLIADLKEDGSILLIDTSTSEVVYHMPAPYMYDANGNYSNNVRYTLEELEPFHYTLKVIADKEWINAPATMFPVVIDPTIKQAILYDTYIDSTASSNNYGRSEELWISSTRTSFIRANLTSIPYGSNIDFATLNVAFYYYSNVIDGSLNVGVYQVLKSWTETGLTWDTANQYTNLGISSTQLSSRTFRGDVGAYQDTPYWQSFVITDAVNSWFNGSNNYGFALKRESGTNQSVIICSYEAGSEYRPYFIIYYTEPIINEGVYRIKNVYNGKYLTVGGTNYLSGAPIQQYSSKGSSDLTQLFKISYIQDYAYDRYYDIRPMTNNELGLYAPISGASRNVQANNMSVTDDWYDIPQTQRWTIQTNSSGGYYTILNAFQDNGGYLSTPTNSTDGAQIVTTTTLTTNGRWVLERYTGSTLDSVAMSSFSSKLLRGSSFDFNAHMYSSTIGTNGPLSYRVRNVDYSNTDKATINSSTGQLTALKCGAIKVGVTYDNAPWIWYWTVEIYDSTTINTTTQTSGILSGNYYYLRNSSSELHADFTNSSSGSPLIQTALSGTQSQRVQFNYIGYGEYELKPAHTNKILTANSSGQVYISDDINSSSQRWYLINNGNCFVIINKAYQSLRLSNNSNKTSGANIILSSGSGFLWEIGGSDKNISASAYSAGVRLTIRDNQYYYDYTIPLNNLFNEAVTLCADHRCKTWEQYVSWAYDISPLFQPTLSGWRGAQLGSFLWFYEQVNHNAVWDIKREARWNDALPNIPYLGLSVDFVFRDILTNAEGIGNIMYGYTGRATGFGSTTLYWGGGVAAQGDVGHPSVTTPPFYGDDENDYYNIEYGYNLFGQDYPNYPSPGFDGIPLDGWLADIADLILNPGT